MSPYNKHEDSLAHIGRTSVFGTTNMGGLVDPADSASFGFTV